MTSLGHLLLSSCYMKDRVHGEREDGIVRKHGIPLAKPSDGGVVSGHTACLAGSGIEPRPWQ